jgi:membrane protein DedA with SNARE-associated domain
VSVPAGVVKMPWAQFLAYTLAGSLIWNSLLIGLGVALGGLVQEYLQYFDYLIYAAVVGVVVWFVYRAVREKLTQGDTEPDRSAADRVLDVERRERDERD